MTTKQAYQERVETSTQQQGKDVLSWAKGIAKEHKLHSIGWAEGIAEENPVESIGWAEGYGNK
jgi:hypothetical protein